MDLLRFLSRRHLHTPRASNKTVDTIHMRPMFMFMFVSHVSHMLVDH